MLLLMIFVCLIVNTCSLIYRDQILVLNHKSSVKFNRNPYSPLVQCQFLPSDYYQCESIQDIPENETRSCQVTILFFHFSQFDCLVLSNRKEMVDDLVVKSTMKLNIHQLNVEFSMELNVKEIEHFS